MTLQQQIDALDKKYELLCVFDLNPWFDKPVEVREKWLANSLRTVRRDEYQHDQRLIFTLTSGDEYKTQDSVIGSALINLQYWLNSIDISNFFVIILTNAGDVDKIKVALQQISRDPVEVNVYEVDGPKPKKKIVPKSARFYYQYNSTDLIGMDMDDLTKNEHDLLTKSKTFCIYPWIHLHAYPTGAAYPCCFSEMRYSVGNTKTHTLKEIWNSPGQRELRQNMLSDTPNPACDRCYEQEKSGFFSGRQSANKHHGHNINRVHETQADGTLDRFEMTYWDIRFSNLCNLSCRSCGHIFSSSWYQDQAKLAGPEWKQKNKVLNYAGRTETDMWSQLEPHLDYVEQIYFAGGEPLLMEEHYRILDELVRRKRFDVRLVYNTNFTHTDLKGNSVFEYWKQFDSVAVGASLDAAGACGEYIRKGTDWAVVEQNRRDMIEICPRVDFYISPTLSILNAWHLPDFHREWVAAGLIRAQDLNVNILQDPDHYRIDIAPTEYKQRLEEKYRKHLAWLSDQDPLQRATQGFESAITFMNATDNTQLIDTFWRRTHELDSIRNENILDILPELRVLK